MREPGLVEGISETAPDTASMTSRLAAVIANQPSRAQDDLEYGMCALEKAYANESNKRLKIHIKQALELLRHGPDADSDMDNESMHFDD